jgi:16S rRNA (uracil1498-N3)-methyltransferase
MHHLVNVIRLRQGEKVVLSDGKGYWRLCSFSKTGWNSRLKELSEDIHEADAPLRPTCIALAMAKGERGTWAIAKLVELGIDHIMLLSTDRSVVRWSATRKQHALDRLRRIARESSAQSRRTFLPKIGGPVTVDELLEVYPPHELALTDITGESMLSAPQEISMIAIGPEGGWSQRELSLAKKNDIPLLSLGTTIMRSETAAIAAGVMLKILRV